MRIERRYTKEGQSPYADCASSTAERARLEALSAVLDASPRAFRRDQCGDYTVIGKLGHIYTHDQGFVLYVTAPGSPRRWTLVKRRLAFCSLTQDGEDEGCLYLDRLPEPAEAELIREALRIRKRRRLSPEQPNARMPLKPIQNCDKTAPGGPAFGKTPRSSSAPNTSKGSPWVIISPFFESRPLKTDNRRSSNHSAI
jgi:hypothetical protein